MNAKEQTLMEAVDGLQDEIVDFAGRLVACPSTLGNEAEAANVMESEMRKLGLSPVRVPIDPRKLGDHPGFAPVPWSYEERTNVVAVRKADAPGGKSALFNGHLDVVSPEPVSLWKRHPFSSEIHDGWLHGRGAGDMKSGVAAMTYALHAVDRAGFGLKAPVTLEAVIEEECTGNGALACIAGGYDAEAVLIPEPFGPTILTRQVGVLWFKVQVRGRSHHVLDTGAGANAIEKCYLLIDGLKTLETELNDAPHPSGFQSMAHPLNLNVGMIQGGDWPSTTPAQAEFHCRLSYFPGTPYAEMRSRVEASIRRAAATDPWLSDHPPRVEFYGFRSDGHRVSRDLPALTALNGCHKDLTGKDAESYVATCTTDLRAFHFFGKGQVTCFGPVAENIHGADERVRLDSVHHTARVYALFLARWCGLSES